MIFAGWGAHPAMFDGIGRSGYDVVVFWDYRDETFDPSIMDGYKEIFLIGWSMGVLEAQRILAGIPLPVVGSLAINGTCDPVSDTRGIPVDIFNGTLRHLNEQSLWKFYRRMCGGAASLERMRPAFSMRHVDELIEELAVIGERAACAHDDALIWSQAVIGESDAIFPPGNQLNAWKSIPVETWCGMPHYPEWNSIIDRYVVDKELVAERFESRQSSYRSAGHVQAGVARRLFRLWEPLIGKEAMDILELGAGTGVFTCQYIGGVNINTLRLWDIAAIKPVLPPHHVNPEIQTCDAELSIKSLPDASLDCIVSSSTVQWFNSFPDFVKNCHRVLRCGGRLAFSTYGPRTYQELRSFGTPLPHYLSDDTLLTIFDPMRWKVVAHDCDVIVERFDSPSGVFEHMRTTGVNAVHRRGRPIGELRRLLADYPLDKDGKAPLTYQPIYIIVEKLEK